MPTRITGGLWRGRVLRTPEGKTTRPTASRVREALFDILGHDCSGRRVADLYAGSGAVGLEALSRGAESAVFLETDRAASEVLRGNVALVGANARLERRDAVAWAAAPENRAQFDLVFVDPPFVEEFPVSADWLSLVAEGGVLVVQHPSRGKFAWPSEPDRTRVYGESALSFWFRRSGGAENV